MRKKALYTKRRLLLARHRHVRRLKLLIRHPFAVPVVTFVLLGVVTGVVLLLSGSKVKASDSLIVIVSHDHVQQTVPTREPTVGKLLKKLNISLREGDVVEPSLDTAIDQDEFRINIYRAVPVEVVDGTQKTYTFSAATTPRSIATQAGVTTYSEDNLNILPTTNFLREDAIGERVVIDRATPININLYGTPLVLRTHAKTVGDLIKERGITLAKGDSIEPKLSTPIVPDQQVLIAHKGTKLAVETQAIPMPVRVINDPNLAYGTSAVRQQGSPGKKVTTFKIILKNGKEVRRIALQTVVVAQPVTEVKVVGVNLGGIKGDMALAGISPSDFTYADYVISHESGWNPASVSGSGCTGLGQACPGSKLAAACPNWQTDPVCQLRYFTNYASRYGGWYGAYTHKMNTGWW